MQVSIKLYVYEGGSCASGYASSLPWWYRMQQSLVIRSVGYLDSEKCLVRGSDHACHRPVTCFSWSAETFNVLSFHTTKRDHSPPPPQKTPPSEALTTLLYVGHMSRRSFIPDRPMILRNHSGILGSFWGFVRFFKPIRPD